MHSEKAIVIPVRLDEKTFRKFARFDMFSLRKKWIRPIVFSLILIAFATVALLLKKEQSGLIAAVLLAVGLGLPLVYFGSFLSQVNMQAARAKLKPARRVYTVTLRQQGIRVVNNQKKEDPLEMDWPSLHRAFRRKGCTYLYVTENKAFLLPGGQAKAPDPEPSLPEEQPTAPEEQPTVPDEQPKVPEEQPAAPNEQSKVPDEEVWAFLVQHLGSEKCQ